MNVFSRSSLVLIIIFSAASCTDDPRLRNQDYNPAVVAALKQPLVPDAAPKSVLECSTTPVVVKSGQSRLLLWTLQDSVASQMMTFGIVPNGDRTEDLGSLAPVSPISVTYVAPKSVSAAFDLQVVGRVEASGLESACVVRVQPDTDLGVTDDGLTQGLRGNIYFLPANTARLPDFSTMQPQFAIVSANLDIPNRPWDTGFPGLSDRFEWFGIRFDGQILVPLDGAYQFQLSSDDGSILYIDDVKIIDNDSTHAVTTVSGPTIQLTAGAHKIRVDYFQGPRYYIALQLLWRSKASAPFQMVPADFFRRPLAATP